MSQGTAWCQHSLLCSAHLQRGSSDSRLNATGVPMTDDLKRLADRHAGTMERVSECLDSADRTITSSEDLLRRHSKPRSPGEYRGIARRIREMAKKAVAKDIQITLLEIAT